MITEIVEVHAEDHGGLGGFRDRCHDVHERTLAVETAVTVVATVGDVLHLGSSDLSPAKSPFPGQLRAFLAFGTCQRG